MSEGCHPTAGSTRDVDRIARELGIPACPAILAEFSAAMQQEEPDIRKLAGLIGRDIALSAALLKFVNSPFYGLRTKASNAQQALSIIGLRAGANLVTGLIYRNAFPASSAPAMQRFWDESSRMASAAFAIARTIGGIGVDEAHTYTLFRDCGMPVMIRKFPDYGAVLDRLSSTPGVEVLTREDERYHYSHARVGYALARSWLLPEPMCRSILCHHDIEKVASCHRDAEEADRRLVAFGLLVEQVTALRSGKGLCPDWTTGESFVLATLKISAEQIVALVNELPESD